jgi:hypothetical protein
LNIRLCCLEKLIFGNDKRHISKKFNLF